MKRKLVVAFSTLIILLVGFGFWVNSKPQSIPMVQALFSRIAPTAPTVIPTQTELPGISQLENELPWTTRFEQGVQQMQGLSEQPEVIDQQISSLANSLDKEELFKVKQIVFDSGKSGDERLLAAELLSRSPNPATIPLLKEIATASAKTFSKTEMVQQEFRAIQILAVEGIGNKSEHSQLAKEALQDLINKTDDPLIVDRIHRTLWAMNGQGPSPEKQDEQALQKVLNK